MNDGSSEPTVNLTDEEWRRRLNPEQYRVLRKAGTEPAFTGKYWNHKGEGSYTCAGCGDVLFTSGEKFESGCGWPSFWDAVDPDKIIRREDRAFGMRRVEVLCRNCGGHLGHVFDDAPQTPTGERYCINSASLNFQERDERQDPNLP